MLRTTIVLVDDHPIVRQGLRAVLSAEPDLHVVGETGSGIDAVTLVERLRPDALIVDLVMPDLNGVEVIRQVRGRVPQTRAIVLSMHSGEAYVLEALRHGAAGYVLKDASAGELVTAVREAMAGRRYLSPPLSERAIEAYVRKSEPVSLDPYETLTTREREVLYLTAQGLSNAEVAARLSISSRTAETHRSHVMQKLGLHSQSDLIRFALQREIIPLRS